MKIALIIKISLLLLLFCNKSISQTNVIVFTYDNAGNTVQRQVQVMPSVDARFSNPFGSDIKKDSSDVVQFKVYPNPAKEIVNIEGELPKGIESAKVFLFNNSGQVLKTDEYFGVIKPINVNDLKAGLYYLQIKYSKDHSAAYKIIITN